MPTRLLAGTKVPDVSHPWPLAHLSEPARDALLATAVMRTFEAGDVLYVAGAPATMLYLVLDGRVRLLREHGGRSVFIRDEAAGGSLGEVPLFEGTTYPATAIASEPTRCLAVQRSSLYATIKTHPELALAILQRLAGRVRLLVERLDRTANQSTISRLAQYITDRAAEHPEKSFVLGASQQQVAEEIGTVREVVVRGLRTLRRRGAVVSEGRGKYRVANPELLRDFAAGTS